LFTYKCSSALERYLTKRHRAGKTPQLLVMIKISCRHWAVSSLLLLTSSTLFGAGFAIHEHGLSGLGNGYAGGAAAAEDNTSLFSNPAGLTRFNESPQLGVGVHIILPVAEFQNAGTTTFAPDLTGATPGTFVPTSGGGATSDEAAFIPNLFYSHPVSENMVLGLAITVPFGLTTDYEQDWIGRYLAYRSELTTINFNLAAGYKINEQVSLGFGLNLMTADAVLSNAVDFGLVLLSQLQTPGNPNGLIDPAQLPADLVPSIAATRGTAAFDGELELEGDDIGFGWNLGVLFEPQPGTRIGFHYRSEIKTTLEGDADFTVGALEGVLGGLFADQGGMVDLNLPASAQASIYHEINDRWAVMADAFYTWWSRFDELRIQYETGFPPDTVVPENFEDVWRYSVGANYRLNDSVLLRAGYVLDKSPVPGDRFRSPRIPDEDRQWVALGFTWDLDENWTLDAGYVYIFVDNPVINNDTHTSGQILRGEFEADVNIFSLGAIYTF